MLVIHVPESPMSRLDKFRRWLWRTSRFGQWWSYSWIRGVVCMADWRARRWWCRTFGCGCTKIDHTRTKVLSDGRQEDTYYGKCSVCGVQVGGVVTDFFHKKTTHEYR